LWLIFLAKGNRYHLVWKLSAVEWLTPKLTEAIVNQELKRKLPNRTTEEFPISHGHNHLNTSFWSHVQTNRIKVFDFWTLVNSVFSLVWGSVGCPKMHQLLKSHAPQAKSNGNHPTELAKSNKSPMGRSLGSPVTRFMFT